MQQQLKQLGLTQLEQALPTLLETARLEQWTYEQFLKRAIGAEIEGRDRRAAGARVLAAPGIRRALTTAGVPRRPAPWLRRRQAAEPCEVGDCGMRESHGILINSVNNLPY